MKEQGASAIPRMSVRVIMISLLLVGLFLTVRAVIATYHIDDINPDASDNSNANASTGGRVNGIGADPTDNTIFYAASEYGGLFKTTDGGATWSHLDNHFPQVTWDVAVDPDNANRVYATSWYDGRVNPLSGIEISTDGGSSWTHPSSAIPDESGGGSDNTPQGSYNCNDNRIDNPSAFGIGVNPSTSGARANNVYIGTNCGLARSTDNGATWEFVDPTPSDGQALNVWDVVVQDDGTTETIDICGDDGHVRSTDGGNTWTPGGLIPGGRCSIAVSPDESYVLFILASDNNLYESDDAGANWTNLGNQGAQGRIPFIVTNQRSDDGDTDRFDAWYSDTQLFRIDCTTPDTPSQGGSTRCPTSASWTNYQSGAHWDAGDLEFDTSVSVDACPLVYSTDGGMHINTVSGSPACHAPTWQRSNVGLHALWSWTFAGADQGGNTSEDLYFGVQDNGTLASTNAGAASPTWTNPNCCDTFDMAASPSWVLGTTCCFSSGRFNRLQLANPGYGSPAQINTYPAGNIPGFTFAERMAWYGGDNVALITTAGLNVTSDITANPISWTNLGAPAGVNPCGVWAAQNGGSVTFYLQSGQCTGRGNDTVHMYSGTTAGGTWTRIDNNDGLTGGFGVFAADPEDPNRLIASNLETGNPHMVISTNGGTNWDPVPELDTLMTRDGVFRYLNAVGPTTNRGGAGVTFSGYPQPSMMAYDPENTNILVAGGIDSGIFVSLDSGTNWAALTDYTNGAENLPRPRFGYFDHDGGNFVYVATQGRGVWRIELVVPVADIGGPYTGDEGSNIALDASGSDDLDGDINTYEWDFDNDGVYDDATGDSPNFLVGDNGVYPISVKVTDDEGNVDTDSTTVTVDNVAPTVDAGENQTTDEGTTVSLDPATFTDPGFLDTHTATIDWGDGTAAEAGTVTEAGGNGSVDGSHVYADNGVYTVTVTVTDDDGDSGSDTFDVTVNNVPPTVEAGPDVTIDENGTVTLAPATFNDKGTLDTHTASIDWGYDAWVDAGTVTESPFGPPGSTAGLDGTVDGSRQYGDNGTFTVTVTVTDDDGGVGSDTFEVTVNNVDPTAEIDESGTILINGMPTFLAHVGEPITFSGRSTDPGSDDLDLSWNWDDGAPAPDITTTYLNDNAYDPDPFPSPEVNPRDETDIQDHAFDEACMYEIVFSALDDDSGYAEDMANVLIVGNADRLRSQGYWQHQFKLKGKTDFTEDELECYLAIVDYVSNVFDEEVDASTIEKAFNVLSHAGGKTTLKEQFDSQLLAAWLNFANGAVEWDEMIDIDGDSVPDMAFYEVMSAAETVRLDPGATKDDLEYWKDILESINTRDG